MLQHKLLSGSFCSWPTSLGVSSRVYKLAIKLIPTTVVICVSAIVAHKPTFASAPSAVTDPDYVIFTLMGPQALGSPPMNGVIMPENYWNTAERDAVAEIKKEFGEQIASRARYVGFSVSLTPTLNLKPEQLKAQITYALDLAERMNLPVFFHLDDQHFWWQNTELSQNKDMQEWSDFPKAGEQLGRVVPRYWLNWGDPAVVYPAPPPCLACQSFRAAVAQRLKVCVGEPIAQRLSLWRKQGREYLFAGVAAGNETQVPDFSRGYEGYRGIPGDIAGEDRTGFPVTQVRMSKEDMVPVGYHSLQAMGYDLRSIASLAKSQNKSVKLVTQDLLYKVVHDYAELQAKTLNMAGVPKDRIYTHFTSSNRSLAGFDEHKKNLEKQAVNSKNAGSENLSPPISASINSYSRPGFTVVRSAVDLNNLSTQLHESGAPNNGKAWAAVESYSCSGQPGTPQTEAQYKEFLGGLLAHGAKVVNVYGWNIPAKASPYAVRSSGVIPAVQRWLAGERLPTTWIASPPSRSQAAVIEAKLAKLQQVAHQLIDKGHDPHPIKAIIDAFQSEFEPLMKAEKTTEAEAVLNHAIAKLQSL